jgi:hypothetical protein
MLFCEVVNQSGALFSKHLNELIYIPTNFGISKQTSEHFCQKLCEMICNTVISIFV